jgi:hypothetical protein
MVRHISLRGAVSLCAIAFAALWMAPPARAGEAYYLLMFASQRVPNNPNNAHTFATFVRVCWEGDGPCPSDATFEAHTISWLPANLVIRVQAICAETGHNFGLHETIRFLQDQGERLSLWGPYLIEPELFERAMRRKARLESGSIRYKADDAFRNDSRVSNCIHAVSAVAEGPRLVVLEPGYGEMASYVVLRKLTRWIIDPNTPHYQVSSALGLDQYPIIYRDRVSPRSGAVFGPIYRLLGGERDLRATFGPPLP